MKLTEKIKYIKQINQAPFTTPDFLSKSYLPSLDGWRAVAIILVILGHAKFTEGVSKPVHNFLETFVYAELGVKIFFVLSGFLITTLLIKEYQKNGRISLKAFYIRRLLRIFPVFYLYLFVLLLVNYLLQLNLSWQNFAGAALYLNNFSFFAGTWLTGHSWSLAVEEQFYILWPLVFILLPKKSWMFCLYLIASLPFFRLLWYFKPDLYQITLGPFIGFADALMTGCLFSILSFKGMIHLRQKIWKSSFLGFSALLMIGIVYYCSHNGKLGFIMLPFGNTVCNISIAYLLLRTVMLGQSRMVSFLNLSFMKKLGVLSYSLYIWQQLFLVPHGHYDNKISWSVFPLNIVMAFVAAWFSYNYYERYFIKLKSRFSRKDFAVTAKQQAVMEGLVVEAK